MVWSRTYSSLTPACSKVVAEVRRKVGRKACRIPLLRITVYGRFLPIKGYSDKTIRIVASRVLVDINRSILFTYGVIHVGS